MLFDAIFMKVLHLPTETIFRGVLVTFAIVGVVASFGPSFAFHFMEKTRKARARNKRELNAELQGKYDRVCRELREKSEAHDLLAQENSRLVELLREEVVHDRDWTVRTRRELDLRKAASS